jgi:iron complex outermembrane receptor protein
MLALACASLPVCTLAQPEGGDTDFVELSLEELMDVRVDHVYGASRYEQKVTRAPASISIITAEDIRRHGHRTLAEALQSVRSLYVSNDRNYVYLGMRGFLRPGDYTTRVLVLVDGHRINDNLFDSGVIGREGMVDVELIDRIEVIRGPGSTMYGSSAFLGVINIVTKEGADVDGLELGADAGSHEAMRARAVYGEQLDSGLELMVSGGYYTSSGVERLYYPEFDQRISDDPRARNDGVASGLDDEAAHSIFASASYGDLSVSAFHAERDKNVPTGSFGTVFDAREWTRDYRSYVDVRYERRLHDDLQLRGSVYADEYRYLGSYPYDYAEEGAEPDIVDMRDGAVGQWIGTEWSLSARLQDRHTLLFGGEHRENVREFQYSYDDLEERQYYLAADRSSSTSGVYAQAEIELAPPLVLIGGARYDYYGSTFGGHLSPRAAVIYSPTATSTMKALYGRAFRAPNPYELYYYIEQQLRPTLAPETIDTYELVYEQYIGRAWRLGVSAYQYDVDDLVTQQLNDAGEYYWDNIERTRARGVELELGLTLPSGFSSTVSYTQQRSIDVLADQDLSASPRRMAKLNMSAPLWGDKLTAGLQLQYQSEMRTLSGGRTDDAFIGNLNVTSRGLWRGVEASFGLYNVFDANYAYPGAEDHLQDALEQEGRTFRGSLTYRF